MRSIFIERNFIFSPPKKNNGYDRWVLNHNIGIIPYIHEYLTLLCYNIVFLFFLILLLYVPILYVYVLRVICNNAYKENTKQCLIPADVRDAPDFYW
jgi:hypothetical protein